MRTLAWLIVLLLNLSVALAFAPSIMDAEIPAMARAESLLTVVLFLAIATLLISARLHRAPLWGVHVMKLLCWGVPVLWFLGALDYGMISGLEFYSLIFAAMVGWGSWWVFHFFSRTHP